MDPVTGSAAATVAPQVTSSLITAGAGLLGGALGSTYSSGANKQARKNMYRQFRLNKAMRSTAVQDRMGDLKRAGINPILAGRYDADSPASTALQAFNSADGATRMADVAANTARAALMVDDEEAKIKQENELYFEQFLKTHNEADQVAIVNEYLDRLKGFEADQADSQAAIMVEMLKGARRAGQIAESDFGLYMRYLGEFTGAIGNVFGGSATYRMNP